MIDGRAAIDYNHAALRRILAGLVAMVEAATGLAIGEQLALLPRKGSAASRPAEKSKFSPALTLPRHLYIAVLGLLRPAELAVRRLIIALSRHLPPVPAKARPMRPPGRVGAVVARPSVQPGILVPLWARPTLGAPPSAPKSVSVRLSFPLLDPLPNPRRRRWVAAGSVPRISMPGITELRAIPPPKRPAPDDAIDATRLSQRLAALASVLDDLPAQAARFARWQALRDAAGAQNKSRDAAGAQHKAPRRRIWPLRPGGPPGGRLSRYDPLARRRRNIREVDEILAHAHALAVFTLERHDTS